MDEGDGERLLQLFQFCPHADLQERIERRQRLVEKQCFRVRDQRARKRHTLLLAARQLRRSPVGVGLHLHELQHLKRLCLARLLVDALHLQAEGDVVDEVEMRKERVILKHHRRTAIGGTGMGDLALRKHDVAFGHRLMSGSHAQRRRLAATGWTEQAAIGAGRHLEIDGVDGERIAVALRQSDKFKIALCHLHL
jgi:hypothetical protein